ncbi:tetratricopeptide repeat-containing sulfotransferase family protein [Sphingomonas profundi]|uniref:tetratricopeptide repeat-containing sulfotransferase family protein n=1 Tax=Alterirhizorhabdus profundi TaxID=2681549 RepID=UPI0012E9433C|nr:sulfotransferase [Sphingomonas profundi]
MTTGNARPREATGTLEAAIAHTRLLLARDPALALAQTEEILRVVREDSAALLLRGQALAALGRAREAVTALRRAAERDRGSAGVWRALADQLVLTGDGAAADAAYARAIRASVHVPVLIEAAEALVDNRLAVAERLLKPHLKAHPTDVAAIRMLAELAGRIGRNADAEALLRRAIELAPSFAPARFNLATLLYRTNQLPAALEQLRRLAAEEPGNAAYRNLAAAALAQLGDTAEAIDHFEAVLGAHPDYTRIRLSYGHALKTVGRQGDSVAAYRRCIADAPGFGEAWWSLANLKTVRLGDDDVAAMTAALALPTLSPEDRLHLHFALGKAEEDAGRVEAAFGHYATANRLRLELVPYDPAETCERVDRTIALFTGPFLAARVSQGCPAPDPIFVLGMPRAGSTLIEQILASHPRVEGTQELPDIQMMAQRLGLDAPYPACLATLNAAALRALGEEYLDRARAHRKTDRPFFVDKMPNNWLHIGLIQLILPNARIVDARRHPIACGFSNFKQHFARGQAFAYDLGHMGRYYADYVRLMAHFDAVLPGRIHRVFHEALVADTESEVRRLLAALGLPFDPACLRFHETERPVRTASSEQVRRPISRSGIDAWRAFAPWLEPLRTALGPVVAEYPHP